MADIDEFTLLIDHSVIMPSSNLQKTSRNMSGLLFVDSGTEMQQQLCTEREDAVNAGGQKTDTAPCYLKPKQANGLDFFSVHLLLQAMGISLDDESAPGTTIREAHAGFASKRRSQLCVGGAHEVSQCRTQVVLSFGGQPRGQVTRMGT